MTEFKIKNKGIEFKTKNTVNMVPSKLFPLASNNTRNIKVFTRENTKEINDEKIKEIFNNYEYRIGKCFANARDLQALLEQEGVGGWDYYSGWLFLPDGYPVFHAWLVNGDSMLDYTDSVLDDDTFEKMKEVNNEKEKRKLLVDEMVRKSKLKPSNAKVCGRAHQEHIYIGTKDTYDNSANIMLSFSDTHPSYTKKGMNLEGLSDLQLEIENKKQE